MGYVMFASPAWGMEFSRREACCASPGCETSDQHARDISTSSIIKRNIVKIIGYIPILGGIPAGIMHIGLGMQYLSENNCSDRRHTGQALIFRGVAELLCLGPLLLVADLVKSLIDLISLLGQYLLDIKPVNN